MTADRSAALKYTKGGKFGQVLDQDGPALGYRLNLRDALPSEYLQRQGLQNVVFGDAIRLIGIENTPEGPSFVVKQPALEGPHPELAEVEAFMDAHGFKPLPESFYDPYTLNESKRPWYRARDGVVVTDAKPENFILDGGHRVTPVDLIVQILPDELLDAVRSKRPYTP